MKATTREPDLFSRKCLLFILILELISTIERQIFDFLGYMWLPIAINFLNILLVIFGLFGLFEKRQSYILSYCIWTLFFWLTWNVFLICYYKNVGALNNSTQDVLSLGTGSFSWWFANGLGCVPEYHFDKQDEEDAKPSYRPSSVNGCKMNYEDVEVCHAGIQVFLGVLGLILASIHNFLLSKRINRRLEQSKSNMYSIEYSPKVDAAAPMTPRRIKRRQRSAAAASNNRNSVRFNQNRNSRHRLSHPNSNTTMINPVNRLISQVEECNYEQNNSAFESSRPNSLYGTMIVTTEKTAADVPPQSAKPGAEADRCPSSLTNYSNFHQQRRIQSNPTTNLLTQEELVHSARKATLDEEDEEEELPLPPPPLEQQQLQPEPSPRFKAEKSANYVNVPLPYDESYTDTQTLYAGSNNLRHQSHHQHKEYGAIPKKFPLHGHGIGCVCSGCQRKLTAI